MRKFKAVKDAASSAVSFLGPFCVPCIALRPMIRKKEKELKDLNSNLASTRKQLSKNRADIDQWEEKLLEANGLKNELNKGKDNFKVPKFSLKSNRIGT